MELEKLEERLSERESAAERSETAAAERGVQLDEREAAAGVREASVGGAPQLGALGQVLGGPIVWRAACCRCFRCTPTCSCWWTCVLTRGMHALHPLALSTERERELQRSHKDLKKRETALEKGEVAVAVAQQELKSQQADLAARRQELEALQAQLQQREEVGGRRE